MKDIKTMKKIRLLQKKKMTLKDELLAIQADTARLRRLNKEWEVELKADEDRHMIVMLQYELNRR